MTRANKIPDLIQQYRMQYMIRVTANETNKKIQKPERAYISKYVHTKQYSSTAVCSHSSHTIRPVYETAAQGLSPTHASPAYHTSSSPPSSTALCGMDGIKRRNKAPGWGWARNNNKTVVLLGLSAAKHERTWSADKKKKRPGSVHSQTQNTYTYKHVLLL